MITRLIGWMAGLSTLAIPLAIFTDTTQGEGGYTVWQAILASILFGTIFTILRRR
jgi:hypothetical protein